MPIICYSCSFHLICFFLRKNCCWCLVTSFPTFVDWIIKRRILLVKVKNFHDFFYTYQLIHFSFSNKSERNLKNNINLKIHRKKGSMLLKKNIYLYFNFTTFFFKESVIVFYGWIAINLPSKSLWLFNIRFL